jgi:hypothetical protein
VLLSSVVVTPLVQPRLYYGVARNMNAAVCFAVRKQKNGCGWMRAVGMRMCRRRLLRIISQIPSSHFQTTAWEHNTVVPG